MFFLVSVLSNIYCMSMPQLVLQVGTDVLWLHFSVLMAAVRVQRRVCCDALCNQCFFAVYLIRTCRPGGEQQ